MTGQTRRRRSGTTAPIVPAASAEVANSSDSVARRAFELFLERGGVHGYDVDDWLAAESELSAPPAVKKAGPGRGRGRVRPFDRSS